jgi:hypothetical protein
MHTRHFLWSVLLVVNLACSVQLARRILGGDTDGHAGWGSYSELLIVSYEADTAFNMNSIAYVGRDFPTWYNSNLHPVEMTYEETVHYPLDSRFAQREWFSTRAGADGHQGYTHLGPERRTFLLGMFHELHCLNTIRIAVINHDSPIASSHHVQHCLNYMRQLFLCSADDTLEPYDFLGRNYGKERVGVTRRCRDWSQVYDDLGAGWTAWQAEAKAHGSEHQCPIGRTLLPC